MRNRLGWLVFLACLSAPIGALAQGRPIVLSDRAGGRDHALELALDVMRTAAIAACRASASASRCRCSIPTT